MDDAQITSGFLSHHVGGGNYNENNVGLGYRFPSGVLLGAYLNSLNKPSAYVAKEWLTDPYRLGPVALRGGALAGLATGYEKPLTPLAMLEALATIDEHTLALGLIPPVKNVTPPVLAFQYRRKF